jgi:hypothetical protein
MPQLGMTARSTSFGSPYIPRTKRMVRVRSPIDPQQSAFPVLRDLDRDAPCAEIKRTAKLSSGRERALAATSLEGDDR